MTYIVKWSFMVILDGLSWVDESFTLSFGVWTWCSATLRNITQAYGSMHKNLSADNIPIAWIKLYLGPDLVFQKGADNSPIG